jgi:hypothetical protein
LGKIGRPKIESNPELRDILHSQSIATITPLLYKKIRIIDGERANNNIPSTAPLHLANGTGVCAC